MKRFLFVSLLFVFVASGGVFAQITVSGTLDSTVSMLLGTGDSTGFSFGLEEYANIRFQSRLRSDAVVYGAFNLIAASGDYAKNAALMAGISPVSEPPLIPQTAFFSGENFISGIELERLYFRLRGEHTDFDGGLFRLPFGYGQIWGPSDFLNPRNPLKPDARPRGILGALLIWYPNDDLKLQTFAASPRNPFANGGEGLIAGLSLDQHWSTASLQALYTYEMPQTGSSQGIHRAGFSLKADIEVGFVMDVLYTFNPAQSGGSLLDGLSFSAGFDYSFLGGDLIVLAEYLYNGEKSSTALEFLNNHYLYAGATYRFNDFTSMNAALMICFDDFSITPIISVNHNLFQGALLNIMAQIPLDNEVFSSGKMNFLCSARLRLRF